MVGLSQAGVKIVPTSINIESQIFNFIDFKCEIQL